MSHFRIRHLLKLCVFVLTLLSVFTSSVGLPSSLASPSIQIVESDSQYVKQLGNWVNVNTPNASGDSYLYNNSASDALEIDFLGSYIDVIYLKHPSFGSFTVEIDNIYRRTIFANSAEATFDSHAVFDNLDQGLHTLRNR